MLNIKSIVIRNFMSIGNVSQSINFTEHDLILVLGENMDLGGDGSKNGTGKTTIANAISYALFGSAITNIKKDNLINATNMKNMVVTLDFELNGISYRIERGRKPNIFKFFKSGQETQPTGTDEAQGENRNTQEEIEQIIGISHDMFKHIVALNTYVEPFLSLKANDQRIIIEQLLGITKLSEKADLLRKDISISKDLIKEEEFKINAAIASNKRINDNISQLKIKSNNWIQSHNNKIVELESAINLLLELNINQEIQLHIDVKEYNDMIREYQLLHKEIIGHTNEISNINKNIQKLEHTLSKHNADTCPRCKQLVDEETHNRLRVEDQDELDVLKDKLAELIVAKDAAQSLIELLPNIANPDTPFYSTLSDAYNHKTSLETLGNDLVRESELVNPYLEQIEMLESNSIQSIDYSKLNELTIFRDHQDFLLKLLTNKDSFIRKKIIDQNLTFLNQRLGTYLNDMGLPHTVKFKSDLEVEISLFGKDFDFDNLSGGERTRLILSLSWTFRDVYENMNNQINLLFVDELIDGGLDTVGVESSLSILKNMTRISKRNIFLISHKEELVSRVPNILKVIKEGGFTTFNN